MDNMEYYVANENKVISSSSINQVDNKPKGISIIKTYGENLTDKEYVTNPAIARDEEIMKAIMILLTPEKSAILVGKAGIGKTSIVEGIAYRIINNQVPDRLKGYQVIKINSSSLIGTINNNGNNELAISISVNELTSNSEITNLFISLL